MATRRNCRASARAILSTSALPSDPELLSYLVAAAMQVETAQRQRLLEIDGTAERLAAVLRLLRREAALLDRMLVRSKDHAGLHLN